MNSFFPEMQLSPDIIKELSKRGKQIDFKPKDIIILQEQCLEELFFIETGFVKCTLFSFEGGVQTICYLGKGFFLGEYSYICGGGISAINIEAATELRLLVFSQNNKKSLFEIQGFKKILLRNMALLARIVKNQIENISLNNSEQRIQKTLDDAEERFTILGGKNLDRFCLTKKEIADLSGCSIETVNRFIKS